MVNAPSFSKKPSEPASAYAEAGVDAALAARAVHGVVRELGGASGVLDGPYFAAVIEFAGTGLALCTDGVGSKALVAQMMERYDTIGIDCVAMNVNDLICVGARPVSMLNYIAVDVADPDRLAAIARGLRAGAEEAGVSVAGGEVAQLGDIIKSHDGRGGFDLVGMAVGEVALDAIVIGANIEHGDAVVGLASNGVHSNGLTLARRALFDQGGLAVDEAVSELGRSVGEELLAPTHIYVRAALEMLGRAGLVKALAHITGDGFLNLTRVERPVGYVLDRLPPPPAIFSLIQKMGGVSTQEMFGVFNMGVGLCAVTAASDVDAVIEIAQAHGFAAQVIGSVDAEPAIPRSVRIPEHGLIGEGTSFRRE